jgi:hypothetical protein
MGRVYRSPVTCIPLHVKEAPWADHLQTACALVTFIVMRTTKVASRRLWAIDAMPPGTAHSAMGVDALRRHHHSSHARAVVHQPPPAVTRPGGAGRRRALGDHAPCMPIEEAVRDFVTHHLSPPDP